MLIVSHLLVCTLIATDLTHYIHKNLILRKVNTINSWLTRNSYHSNDIILVDVGS